MNKQRILIGAAWLASVAAAYWIGNDGETARFAGAVLAGETGELSPSGAGQDRASTRDRVQRRSMDEMQEPPEQAKEEVRQILAQTLAAMGRSGGARDYRGMQRWMVPLASLKPSQVEEALNEVERTVKSSTQRWTLNMLLLGQWAETDPRAALAYGEQKLTKADSFDDYRGTILQAWGRQDPEAAWRWLQTEGQGVPPFSRDRLILGMAENDLEQAFRALATFPSSTAFSTVQSLGNSLGSEAAGSLLEHTALLPADLRQRARVELIKDWARRSPDAAVQWLHSLPEEEQAAVRRSAAGALLQTDSKKAAELYLENLPENDRAATYEIIARVWGNRDPQGAADWLAKLPQGMELDSARSSYAKAVVDRDPAAAMAWAKTVQQAEVRAQAVSAVFGEWHAKDPAAAAAALQDSGLSAEKIRELKAQPPKPEPNNNNLYFFFSANFQSSATTALADPAAVLQPARPRDAFLRTAC